MFPAAMKSWQGSDYLSSANQLGLDSGLASHAGRRDCLAVNMVCAVTCHENPGNRSFDHAARFGKKIAILIKRNDALESTRIGNVTDCDEDTLARHFDHIAGF